MNALLTNRTLKKNFNQINNSFMITTATPVIAVVLPIYNPPKDWWKQSLKYCQHLAKVETKYRWVFHFVNDGSTHSDIFPDKKVLKDFTTKNTDAKGTPSDGDNFSIFFHAYEQNRGKGHAIRYGLEQVDDKAEIFMHCDWDFPFGTNLLLAALPVLKYTDVVLADRGGEYLTHLPFFRQQLTKTQRFMNRYLMGLNATDTQAGFKAFNAVGKSIFLMTTIDGFLFDTEFVKYSERNNLTIKSLDASCRPSLQFKNFRFKVLLKEALSLVSLVFK